MKYNAKHPLLTGALFLTLAGFFSRFIGFFYKIFLSRVIGAEGMGIYQLVFPVYAFAFSLSAAGIQTGISRCCASSLAAGDSRKTKGFFLAGTGISLAISLICTGIIVRYAEVISLHILKEQRCAPLLHLIAFSLPAGTLHTCINAWYFSSKRTLIPSATQLLEQLVRVGASWMIYLIFIQQGMEPTPLLAAGGVLAGEIVSGLLSSICILLDFQKTAVGRTDLSLLARCGQQLIKLSAPLTANRILLNLLQSAEAIMIPARLQIAGLSSSQALSVYGILTGMALPFILFPSAITSAVSTMLLPSVAGDQAAGNHQKIQEATEKTIKYCLLLGILCAGVFFTFGPSLGTMIYHNEDAGVFLRMLSFLCPFLYLTSTLSSILNGLGHTGLSFLQNAAGLLIRILFAVFAIPRYGIQGYLIGLLISQIVMFLLNLYFLSKSVPIFIASIQWIFLPLAALMISCTTGKAVLGFLRQGTQFPAIICLMPGICISGLLYFLLLTAMGIVKTS